VSLPPGNDLLEEGFKDAWYKVMDAEEREDLYVSPIHYLNARVYMIIGIKK
jgi:hypothetical protein